MSQLLRKVWRQGLAPLWRGVLVGSWLAGLLVSPVPLWGGPTPVLGAQPLPQEEVVDELPTTPETVPVPTLIVNKLALTNDPNDGKCDLWEALKAAFDSAPYHGCNANSLPTVIGFSADILGGTIQLPASGGYPDLPMIRSNVTIIGPITVNGGGFANDTHIFNLASDGSLTLINMTLINAYTSGSGAAILSQSYGAISLIGVSVTGNIVDSDGGAIYTNGPVNIIGSSFTGNIARGVISSTTVTDNPGVGFGGALVVQGYDKLKIAGSAFSGNIADKGGGAIYFSGGTAEITDVTFNGNLVQDNAPTTASADNYDGGGAIYNDANATLWLTRTAFSGNLNFVSHGGALALGIDGNIEIADTSFNGNVSGDGSHTTWGGAIYNAGGILKITRSAFILNTTTGDGGALHNDRTGEVTLSNSTFTGNNAQGNGGALWNGNTITGPATFITAYNLTLSGNSTNGGAIYRQNNNSYTISVGNTIVDQGNSGCNIPITSVGNNLDRGNACLFQAGGDKINTDPLLKPLGFNGGAITSLLSMALQNGSPAIDTGHYGFCENAQVDNQDQRGKSRPQDGDGDGGSVCDMGAVENDPLKAGYASSPVQPGPIDLGNTTFGTVITTTFRVSETGNTTLNISSANLSGPNASEFGISTTVPLNIADGAPYVNFQVSCTPVGPNTGNRTATLTLTTNDPENTSVAYNLTCNGSPTPQAGFSSSPIAPGPIDFGEITVGTSGTVPLTVIEVGTAVLTLTNGVLGGVNAADFQIVTSFPVTIANGGAPKTIDLRCNPQAGAYGTRTATFTFNTNDTTANPVSFNLVCKGVATPPPLLDVPGQSVGGSIIPLTGPYGIAVSPDSKFVYVAGLTSDSVYVYARSFPTNTLAVVQGFQDPSGDLNGPYLARLSPDGKNVYVSASSSSQLIAYERNPTSGYLTKIDAVGEGDGYACLPTCAGYIDGMAGTYGIAISPDGKYVYVSGINDDGIVVLRRNTDGTLRLLGANFVQAYTNTAQLDQAYDLAVSPEGTHLYATGYAADSLVVFTRSVQSGVITYSTRYTASTVPGLNGVFRVIVSPDGQFVYTASYDSDSVTAFRRNPLDGRLTHLATYTQGLDAATSVALSPDGEYLFATGFNSDSLVVFKRNPATGLLTVAQTIVRNAGTGLPALDGARDVVASPDGQMVFATGFNDNRVVALQRANPTPLLASLSPASTQAGSPSFTLEVHGENFVPGAVVRWNGSNRTTTYINATELRATIRVTDVTSAGTYNITVVNPTPGGGLSANTLQFVVSAVNSNPVPAVEVLVPQGANAGDPGFTLTVLGSNFVNGSTVQWNGSARATTFISSTQLQATILTSDIAQPGSAGVRVNNPTPGGGNSNMVTFDIAGPGENPAPTLIAVSPDRAYSIGAGSSSFTLVVTGTNFIEGAQVLWDGSPRPTTFVSSTRLEAIIDGSDLVFPGSVGIQVNNPAPGGGDSNTLAFIIYQLYRIRIPFIGK